MSDNQFKLKSMFRRHNYRGSAQLREKYRPAHTKTGPAVQQLVADIASGKEERLGSSFTKAEARLFLSAYVDDGIVATEETLRRLTERKQWDPMSIEYRSRPDPGHSASTPNVS